MMKEKLEKYIDSYMQIINEDANTNTTEFKDITDAQETILFINFLRKKHIDIPPSVEKNYEFNPIIVHSDYEKSISIALKNSKFFKNDIIHIKCFFHFIKSIREHLKKYTKNKRYLTKINYEILKDIEIICFIEEGK